MSLATFDFEGGSNNATATTTTTGASFVSPGTGGTIKHQAAAASHGAVGLEFVTGTTAGCYIEFDSTKFTSSNVMSVRFDYTLPSSSLSNTPSILQSNGASNGTTTVFRLQLTTSDVLQMMDNGSAHTVTGPDLTAYLGTQISTAIQFSTGNTSSNGTTTVRVYASPQDAAADYIAEFSSSGAWNLGGSSSTAWPLTLFRMGINQTQTASRTVRIDNVRIVDSATWLDGTAVPATITMAGAGTLGITGSLTKSAGVTMAGSGALAVTPQITVQPAVTMAGSGTLSVTANVTTPAVTATVTMAGSGSLTVAGQKSIEPSVSMAGAGTLSVTAQVTSFVTVTMAGAGTLAVSPLLSKPATVSMTGAGTLTVNALKQILPAVLMAGSGTLTAVRAHTPSVTFTGAGTLTVVTTANSRVVFLNVRAEEGAAAENSRVVFLGIRATDQGALTLELDGPTQVDPFSLVDIIATVSGGISQGGISWLQTAGKAAEVLESEYRLRFYAPADIDPGVISWRATIDDGVTADISIGIWPAHEFYSTPAGEWIPTTTYELVEVP